MSVLREITVKEDENGDFHLPEGQVLSATVTTKDIRTGQYTRPTRVASVWIVFENDPEPAEIDIPDPGGGYDEREFEDPRDTFGGETDADPYL